MTGPVILNKEASLFFPQNKKCLPFIEQWQCMHAYSLKEHTFPTRPLKNKWCLKQGITLLSHE